MPSERLEKRRATSGIIQSKSSSVQPYIAPKMSDATPSNHSNIQETMKTKRFSLVPMSRQERRVTIRPYESFRERKDEKKDCITFGYAALSTSEEEVTRESDLDEPRSISPSPSIFSIYGEEPGPSTICEQPIGAQADIFISSLGDKKLGQIKKFLENTPREEHMYFLWVKDSECNKITVISIKTLENHLKNNNRIRRVKWRHLSTERVSIYRYSLPAITSEKSKLCRECICRHKKICLLLIWLSFVLFLCLVVILGSLSPDDTHLYSRHRNVTVIASGVVGQRPTIKLIPVESTSTTSPHTLSSILFNASSIG